MTHLSPDGPEPATRSIVLSPATLSAPSIAAVHRGLDRDRLRDAIAARRRTLAHLEMTLAAACEHAAAHYAARGVRIDDRATWDKAMWQRYLAAATRLEPEYMPAMRRLLSEIERLERLLSLPAQIRRRLTSAPAPAVATRMRPPPRRPAMTAPTDEAATKLPPLCYVRHPTTGETVAIILGQAGYRPTGSLCSPECLNARLQQIPTADEISAMRHGSLIGWDTPGADPEVWRRRRTR